MVSFTVAPKEKDIRIDKILVVRFPEYSRNYLQDLIDKELVLCNGVPIKKRISPKVGDEITVEFIRTPDEQTVEAEDIPLDIIYEDDSIIAINKLPGMVVHPAKGNWTGTVVNALVFRYQNLPEDVSPLRPGIIHRLDKDTSGVLLAAKTSNAQYNLMQQFADRKVHKRYLGICVGNPGNRTIETLIARHPVKRQQMSVSNSKGKFAITKCRTIAHNNELSIVEFVIETGRTHQIRVHMQSIGMPILGDNVYGYDKANNKYDIQRQLLHAEQIQLKHPVTQEEIVLKAPLPQDIINIAQSITGDKELCAW